jgi:hypothetical protein
MISEIPMDAPFPEFEPPNRVAGPIVSAEDADHVRVRLAALLLLVGPEFLRLRHILRDDVERLIAWEEEQA